MSVNHNTVWKNCLNLIQENISEQGFKTWFKPIVPIRFEDQVLTIQVLINISMKCLRINSLASSKGN